MADFIGLDIQGLPELRAKLKDAPPHIQDAVVEEVADYMLEVLRQYPPQRRVTRKAAYGRTFQSARQRRWFFAALNAGEINVPYRRTQGLRNAWRKVGKGRDLIIANENEGAVWTMDDERQARLNTLVGWKKIGDLVRERSKQIERKADAGLKKGLRKAGL